MKKILFITCMMLTSMIAFAVETKKVAILEVVDKEGKLSYSQKLMLRSNIAKAITQTAGYEAYDRTDIDAIMGEQEFQRTGMVSDNDIRKLGEMTGVSYILVTEGVLMDDGLMFVAAKLLDVETAKVAISDNTMMGLSSGEMQEGCEEIASLLFDKKKKKKKQNIGTSNAIQYNQPSFNANNKNDKKEQQVAPSEPQEAYIRPQQQPDPQPTPKSAAVSETWQIHWDINSRPQGADVYWRIISNTPDVKNQNYKYLETTPYESMENLRIPGLTRENAGEVQIEVKVEKTGYHTQKKKVSVLSLMDDAEVSMMFKLVAEE